MKISTPGPTLNHLLFADDALFFCHAHPKSCTTIINILNEYERVSGHAVNLNKSATTFGSRVKHQVKTKLRRILNIHNDGGCGKYLGLPEQIGRKKKEIFSFVVEKVKQKTKNWSHRFLSEAGKEILLKTVALSFPVYTRNCFKLPKGTCDEINGLLAKYWWSKGHGRKSMHWISWKRMGLPKKKGGLGFRDIENFNLALLGKHYVENFSITKQSANKGLKSQLFPHSTILTAEPGYRASFIRDLLKQGMRVLIGNGKETSIWSDPWLVTNPPRAPRCIDGINPGIIYVNELMNDDGTGWDMNVIRQTVVEEDINLISSIRLRSNHNPDLIGWHYNDSGIYSVKSGYWLASHLPQHHIAIQPPPGSPAIKSVIWKMKISPKLQHFLWRVLSEVIPVGNILLRRGITTNAQCKRCCQATESIEHLFFSCSHVQAIWRGTQNIHQDVFNTTISFTRKLQAIIEGYNNPYLTDLDRHLPLWIMWRIWKSRNSLVYQQKVALGNKILSKLSQKQRNG